jgi:hypothetical protein
MRTASILIGNTDNKLAQLEWAAFVLQTKEHVEAHAHRVHFFGAPPNYEVWQNACWVIELNDDKLPSLKEGLTAIRKKFRQDSVALLVSQTEFI